MRELELLEVAKFTSPNPLALICSRAGEGRTNLAAVSWWTYLSVQPPAIGFAMMKPSYTGERVRETGELILTIPGESMNRQAMGCGSTSGRDTDKAAKFAIELIDVPGSAIKIPAHSVAAIVCGLREFNDVGDHYFYVCDVKKALAVAEGRALFAWGGYSRLAPATLG